MVRKYYIHEKRKEDRGGEGEGGSLKDADMANYRVVEDQGKRLSGSVGSLASHLRTKTATQKKTKNQNMPGVEENTGREKRRHKEEVGIYYREKPQFLTGTWEQANGGKGGKNRHGKQRQTHARSAGRRVDQWRLAGDGCGKRSGGRSFWLGEELGSGCKRKKLYSDKKIMIEVW